MLSNTNKTNKKLFAVVNSLLVLTFLSAFSIDKPKNIETIIPKNVHPNNYENTVLPLPTFKPVDTQTSHSDRVNIQSKPLKVQYQRSAEKTQPQTKQSRWKDRGIPEDRRRAGAGRSNIAQSPVIDLLPEETLPQIFVRR
jgi:hypothetical protein